MCYVNGSVMYIDVFSKWKCAVNRCIEIPRENEGFRGSGGPTHSAKAQNLSLG